MERMKAKIKILAILLVAIFLISSAYAGTLCSYKGPVTSEHDLQLSEFKVSGDSTVNAGDKISAEFKLTYVGKDAVTLDDKYGVFVVAKDPNGVYKTFGNTYQGKTLKAGKSVNFKPDITLDKEGEWILWASYCIKVGKGTKCGPNEWHSCKIKVEAKPICPEGCECLTEAQAKELGYEYCEGAKTLCGYDQYKNSMYCYQKPKEQDTDNDGIPDAQDNCPNNYNPQQEDLDNDGIGNECDTRDDRDSDGDGIKNCDDQCPNDAETFNGYMDDDGCPDEKPEEEPSMSIKKIPENPVLGDRVRYEVSASDQSGIAVIKIFMNGEKKRTCFASSCIYTTHPIEEEPEFGVIVVDTVGNFYSEGLVPIDEILIDVTLLAEGSLLDISDFDNDGVLDANDECCPGCEGLFAKYCCDEWIIGSMTGCRDYVYRENYFGGRVYYWEDFYNYISNNGCGCYDSDGGDDIFSGGYVFVEKISIESSDYYIPSGLPPGASPPLSDLIDDRRSVCSERFQDECVGSNQIREYSCGPNGVINQTVRCPSDAPNCLGDRCVCPDTDGGWDYYNQGTINGNTDECLNYEWLREYSCGDSRDVRCPYGCEDEDGACKCQDSDGGWNPDDFGRVGTHEDVCRTDRILSEVNTTIIRTDEGGECRIIRDNFTCPGLCDYGECLPPTCDDRILNQEEEDVDCGGPCDLPCDLCHFEPKPDYFNYRNWKGKNWLTPVKNQGNYQSNCGSCWAFASIGAVEANYNIEHPDAFRAGTLDILNLSVQYLVSDCASSTYDCGGGSTRYALNYIRDGGIPDAPCYPYLYRDSRCSCDDPEDTACCSDWEDRLWRITEHDRADRYWKKQMDEISRIKNYLFCNGPLVSSGYSGKGRKDDELGGHAVVIVGWDDSVDSWIIKNSWGPSWSNRKGLTHIKDGYGLMPYNHGWGEKIRYVDGTYKD